LSLNNSLHFYNLGTFLQFPSASDRQWAHSLESLNCQNKPTLLNWYPSIFRFPSTSYIKSPYWLNFSDFDSIEIERDSGNQSYLLQRFPYLRFGFDQRGSISVSNKNVKAPPARQLAYSTEQN
jgi:hypothetical protein